MVRLPEPRGQLGVGQQPHGRPAGAWSAAAVVHGPGDAGAADGQARGDHPGMKRGTSLYTRADTQSVPVLPGDTEETLLERLHPAEHRLLVGAVADYFLGRIEV